MAVITVDENEVAPVLVFEQVTGPVNEAVLAGQYTRINTTTGMRQLGNGTNSTEVGVWAGIAMRSAESGGAITFVRRGIISLGPTALSALAYGANVFLSDTDGMLDTAAGTVSTVIGKVVPGYGSTTPDKLLFVDIQY